MLGGERGSRRGEDARSNALDDFEHGAGCDCSKARSATVHSLRAAGTESLIPALRSAPYPACGGRVGEGAALAAPFARR